MNLDKLIFYYAKKEIKFDITQNTDIIQINAYLEQFIKENKEIKKTT